MNLSRENARLFGQFFAFFIASYLIESPNAGKMQFLQMSLLQQNWHSDLQLSFICFRYGHVLMNSGEICTAAFQKK